jgi:hypothetical protein
MAERDDFKRGYWSRVEIPTRMQIFFFANLFIQIDQYEFIQLYKLYSTNSYNYTNCIYIYISSLGSYLRVKYVSSGMMNEWKSKFGAVGGWTNVCIPCLMSHRESKLLYRVYAWGGGGV